MKIETQKRRILSLLRAGVPLTPMAALKSGCGMKLSTRVSELADDGWIIQKGWYKPRASQRVRKYWIEPRDRRHARVQA